MSSASPVLAIGLDAAEPTLLLELIERGELPTLAELHARGTWSKVRSAADLGSGAVWPTFFTGTPPATHGVHGGWAWRPEAMRVEDVQTGGLRPFWRDWEENGLAVGVLDVPFAPPAAHARGFDLAQWGAHDTWLPRAAVAPAHLSAEIRSVHPFSTGRLTPAGPEDRVSLATIASACMEGARLKGDLAARLIRRVRPNLALVVFGETHRVAHDLWHTVRPHGELHREVLKGEDPPSPGLLDVHRELDRQLGKLVETAGGDARIAVFSLHGFRGGRGIVDILQPTLTALGYSCEHEARTASSRAFAHAALASVKRHTPLEVKRIYHRRLPRSARYRLAGPTMLPAFDWTRTRAFALPTDQHGWIRINLRGREAAGVVTPRDYDSLRDELAAALRDLADEDGRPLVREILQVNCDGRPPSLLPDLVVHWTNAALADPVRVHGLGVESSPIAPRSTGQHRAEGFCMTVGIEAAEGGDGLPTEDLHRLLWPGAAGRQPTMIRGGPC